MADSDSLFHTTAVPTDVAYTNLRDAERIRELREFAESLWLRFAPYADSQFRDEFPRAFHQRYWEMYLGVGLLNAGLALEPKSAAGPDLKIVNHSRTIWVEATAPTSGVGADAVPEMSSGGPAKRVPEDQMILRLRSAIETKHLDLLRYIETGVVSRDDIYVIAINGRAIPYFFLETRPPKIVKALFGIGSAAVSIDRTTMDVVESGHLERTEIEKKSGEAISTTVFRSPEYAQISAVLSCNSDAGNHVPTPDRVGEDFTLAFNPYATNALARGVLPTGVEYFEEAGELIERSSGN